MPSAQLETWLWKELGIDVTGWRDLPPLSEDEDNGIFQHKQKHD